MHSPTRHSILNRTQWKQEETERNGRKNMLPAVELASLLVGWLTRLTWFNYFSFEPVACSFLFFHSFWFVHLARRFYFIFHFFIHIFLVNEPSVAMIIKRRIIKSNGTMTLTTKHSHDCFLLNLLWWKNILFY